MVRQAGLVLACLVLPLGTLAAQLDSSIDGTLRTQASLLYNADGTLPSLTLTGQVDGQLRLDLQGDGWKGGVLSRFQGPVNPELSLERAWLRVRTESGRLETGLTRLDWGPVQYLNIANLPMGIFTGPDVQMALEQESMTRTSFLVDWWIALGSEAFLEFAARAPDLPAADWWAGGVAARISAAPGGILTELAWGIDGKAAVQAVSLSTQFNLGLDWYASAQFSMPLQQAIDPGQAFAGAAGCFGQWSTESGERWSSRHELALAADLLRSYHNLAFDDGLGWSMQLLCFIDWQKLRLDCAFESRYDLLHGISFVGGISGAMENWQVPPQAGAMALYLGLLANFNQ